MVEGLGVNVREALVGFNAAGLLISLSFVHILMLVLLCLGSPIYCYCVAMERNEKMLPQPQSRKRFFHNALSLKLSICQE